MVRISIPLKVQAPTPGPGRGLTPPCPNKYTEWREKCPGQPPPRYHLTPTLEVLPPIGGNPSCYLEGRNMDLPTPFTDKKTEAGGGPRKNYGTGYSDH